MIPGMGGHKYKGVGPVRFADFIAFILKYPVIMN